MRTYAKQIAVTEVASERSKGKSNMTHATPVTSESRTSGQVGRQDTIWCKASAKYLLDDLIRL